MSCDSFSDTVTVLLMYYIRTAEIITT